MRTSQRGMALIKQYEGLRLESYLCPAGVWTIGYGHTSSAGAPVVKPGQRITKEEANSILAQDLSQYETAVQTWVKRPLTQGQFDALVSLCYNIGIGAFRKSTLVGAINAGKMENAPAQFMRWTKAGGRELPGLVKRRRAEVALWRALNESEPDGEETRTTPEAPKEKTPAESTTVWAQIAAAVAAVLGGVGNVVTDWRVLSVIAVVVVIGAAVWTIRERVRKMREEGI